MFLRCGRGTDEGIVMANYGVEGKSFNYDADGGYASTDDVLNNQYNHSYRAAGLGLSFGPQGGGHDHWWPSGHWWGPQ